MNATLMTTCICKSAEVLSGVLSDTYCYVFFFFKQKTAYEMRISDWSSDVCSSDLWCRLRENSQESVQTRRPAGCALREIHPNRPGFRPKIGRASCRERVCQYV